MVGAFRELPISLLPLKQLSHSSNNNIFAVWREPTSLNVREPPVEYFFETVTKLIEAVTKVQNLTIVRLRPSVRDRGKDKSGRGSD